MDQIMTTRAPLSLLLVDDEQRSLEALRRTLEDSFTIFTATSAQEGNPVMEREVVQIVMSDQPMRGTSGVEFLLRVRRQWPDTVRVILSGDTAAGVVFIGINKLGTWEYLL